MLVELGMTNGGTRLEFECYDVGHLYTLVHLLDRGLLGTGPDACAVHSGISALLPPAMVERTSAAKSRSAVMV